MPAQLVAAKRNTHLQIILMLKSEKDQILVIRLFILLVANSEVKLAIQLRERYQVHLRGLRRDLR